MKASELIKELQNAITQFGDMDILIRDCSNGYDYDAAVVSADPPSDAEMYDGITGTIDLNIFCESNAEPFIRFGKEYVFESTDSDSKGAELCKVIRMLTPSECDSFDVGNMYYVKTKSGEIKQAFEDELMEVENV